jgi:hypothetical protein
MFVTLAAVELGHLQEPARHPCEQVRGAFADLGFQPLEGHLDDLFHLIHHDRQHIEHTFDTQPFRNFLVGRRRLWERRSAPGMAPTDGPVQRRAASRTGTPLLALVTS